jgi:hypothetical protein
MKNIISVLAGMLIFVLLFSYWLGKATCPVMTRPEGPPEPAGRCVLILLPGVNLTYPPGWPRLLSPAILIATVAAILVAVVLERALARR